MEYSGTWKEIWEQKGQMEGTVQDIRVYDGWEKSNADIEETARLIKNRIDIQKDEKVLEVGCGAGAIAQYLDCDYVGVDFSSTLVKKHIEFFKNSVLVAEANNLPFKDNVFDKVICWGVFLYFPNKEYAKKAVEEMIRVAKKAVFIGEIPIISHNANHQWYIQDDFKQWGTNKTEIEFDEGWSEPYQKERFNVTYYMK